MEFTWYLYLPVSSSQGLFSDALSDSAQGCFLKDVAQSQFSAFQERARTRSERLMLSIISMTEFRINFCKLSSETLSPLKLSRLSQPSNRPVSRQCQQPFLCPGSSPGQHRSRRCRWEPLCCRCPGSKWELLPASATLCTLFWLCPSAGGGSARGRGPLGYQQLQIRHLKRTHTHLVCAWVQHERLALLLGVQAAPRYRAGRRGCAQSGQHPPFSGAPGQGKGRHSDTSDSQQNPRPHWRAVCSKRKVHTA